MEDRISNAIREFLIGEAICPKCRGELQGDAESMFCTSDDCDFREPLKEQDAETVRERIEAMKKPEVQH
jgi:hypothetical protein